MIGRKILSALPGILDDSTQGPDRRGGGAERRLSCATPHAAAGVSGALSQDAFENQLEWLFGESKRLLPGQLVVLRASEIAERFGAKWEAAAERAEAIARRVIERHLSLPQDSYCRLDALTYLLLFAKTPTATATASSARIAVEIAEQLLGDTWDAAAVTLRTVFGQVPSGLESLDISVGGPRTESLLDGILRTAKTHGDGTGASGEVADDPFAAATLVYRPMWDVRLGVLSTYLAVPARTNASGDVLPVRFELLKSGDVELRARLDRWVVGRAADDLKTSMAAGCGFLVGIPVHFDTLAARGLSTEYLAAYEAIPLAVRRFVIFELLDVPQGVVTARLQTIVATLKRRARAVIACLPLRQTDFSPFTDAGVLSVGADVASAGDSERTIIDRMQLFSAAAAKAKSDPFIHGLRSISLASSAIAAGFRYIDGNSVRSLVDAPRTLQRYRLDELYAKLSEGRVA